MNDENSYLLIASVLHLPSVVVAVIFSILSGVPQFLPLIDREVRFLCTHDVMALRCRALCEEKS